MEARIYHPRKESEKQPRFLHISWLYAQDYCEYQLYLEQVKGIAVDDTPAMVEGSVEHQRLEDEFLAKAELDWRPAYPSWREGLEALLDAPPPLRLVG